MNRKLIWIVVIIALGILAFTYFTRPETVSAPTPAPTPAPIVGENPEGEADPARMTLFITEWRWITAQYNDGTVVKPKSEWDFKITFKKDGTFSASTDCNGIGGNYDVDGNSITFRDMLGTLMYCEGSQENDFRKILENTLSYFFTSRGELVLELKSDSGTATFR